MQETIDYRSEVLVFAVTWGVTTSSGCSTSSGSGWSAASGSNVADQAADVNAGQSLQDNNSESLHVRTELTVKWQFIANIIFKLAKLIFQLKAVLTTLSKPWNHMQCIRGQILYTAQFLNQLTLQVINPL